MEKLLQSKPRYEILDGLRGVAAMIVVAFHLFETYSSGPLFQIFNHGYLAVDFFFVLSGFVIGYAYDDRWGNGMGTWTFFKRRLIRLQPMLIIGTLVGLLLFYFGGDCPGFELVHKTPWWAVVLIAIWGFTLLPLPASMDVRGWSEFNPLNGATWSLLWEYVANIMYALFVRRMSRIVLTCFVALGGVLTILLCLNVDIFGVLEARSYAANTVIGGWSLTPDQLLIGFTRLIYPFFGGLLLYRIGKLIKVNHGFRLCSLIIIAILVFPRVGGEDRAEWWMNGVYEAIAILVLFPLVVAIGAGSRIKGKREIKICQWLGEISYPLYVTHYPLIYAQMSWAASHPDLPLSTHIFVGVCFFLISICVAYSATKLYDEPVRAWLRKKFLKR